MGGSNFGSIKNYESVEMDDVEMYFTENGMDISIDNNVAIARAALTAGLSPEDLKTFADKLKALPEEEREAFVKESIFGVVMKEVKDWGAIVLQFLALASN